VFNPVEETSDHVPEISVEQLFIKAAFHQNGFSSKQHFIKSTYKWLIHRMNECVGLMNGQWLFIE
jgi:hypothetical protein